MTHRPLAAYSSAEETDYPGTAKITTIVPIYTVYKIPSMFFGVFPPFGVGASSAFYIIPHRTTSTTKKWLQHHLKVSTFPPLANNLQRLQSRTSQPATQLSSQSLCVRLGRRQSERSLDKAGVYFPCLLFKSPTPKRWSVWLDQSLIDTKYPISVALVRTASRLSTA